MPFEKGNQLALGHGRPKGSGKNQLFRQWCEEKGIQRLFDIAEGKGHGYRLSNGRIIEVGPHTGLQFEALKLALAYGLGRPITPFQIDDPNARDPEESKMRAERVWALIKELENDANGAGERPSDPASVGDRPA